MTIRQAIAYLWAVSGEPTDLDPWSSSEEDYDPDNLVEDSLGVAYYLREFNKAQNLLANMRTNKGRPLRFRRFQTRKNVKLGLLTQSYTDVSITDEYNIEVVSPPSLEVEDYVDTKIKLIFTSNDTDTEDETTEIDRMVVYSELNTDEDGIVFTFQDEIDYPDYTSYDISVEFYFDAFKIYRTATIGTGYTLNLPKRMKNITAVTVMEDGKKLVRAEQKFRPFDYIMTDGTPTQWYLNGEVLYFDKYLDSRQWFIIDYQRLPDEITDVDDDWDVPEQWIDAILMMVEISTARRMQENEKVTVLVSQLRTLMGSLRTEEEDDWIMEETGNFYVRKEAR